LSDNNRLLELRTNQGKHPRTDPIQILMTVGLLIIQLHLSGCSSLKEKRHRLKPLIIRLHKEFNISVAEVDHQDFWQDSTLACAMVSSDHSQTQRSLQKISRWIEANWPDATLTSEHLEIL